MNLLSKDIEIVHRRRWPDRHMSLASCLWLLASSPGLRLMLMYRFVRWSFLKRKSGNWPVWIWPLMALPLAPLKLAIKFNSKGDICHDIEIEDGVCFSDHGYIIFGALKTGSGTIIGSRVTFGIKHAGRGRPKIGRNVWIGSDCVVYGNIYIGDGATLLPGTVLTKSVPENVVMQGNPAQLVLRNFDNSELRNRQDMEAMQYVNVNQAGGD